MSNNYEENRISSLSNEQRARQIAKKKMGFFIHLLVYVTVITFLTILNFVINAQNGEKYYWFFWPAGGWGIGLFFHFIGTFIGGGSLEDRIAEKELERLNRKDGK